VDEIYRVLKPSGIAFISVPAIYPLHGGPYDNWRFMAGGVRVLLNDFKTVRLMAEGGSVASFFRTLNLYLGVFTGRWWGKPIRMLLSYTLLPLNNLVGWYLDRWFSGGDAFVANWLAIARKDR
jgi:SAM-dependent methyltransferase